jgi:glycosyltransferase involved in cell wall biosynthesis
MTSPKVSIVIPSYKVEHFEQCLRSAIAQTYPNIEIIVSDECPTEEIRTICARFPGVVYQRNVYKGPPNSQKGTHNIISSLYSAKGDYIKPLFDDDLLHPFCVERMVTALNSTSIVQLVFAASQVISISNERLKIRRPFQQNSVMAGQEVLRNLILSVNFIGELSCVMFRRDRLWEISPNNLFKISDYDCSRGLWDVATYCNLTEGGVALYMDEELIFFRKDPLLMSNSNPLSNPGLRQCRVDSLGLLSVVHRMGRISTEELLGLATKAEASYLTHPDVMAEVYLQYQRYISAFAPVSEIDADADNLHGGVLPSKLLVSKNSSLGAEALVGEEESIPFPAGRHETI